MRLAHEDLWAMTFTRSYESDRSRSIAKRRAYTADRGVILADTKFEFGHSGDELILIDEVLTPDSSRYWPADEWKPGHGRSFLRQAICARLARRGPVGPSAACAPSAADVIEGTRHRYIEAHDRITGYELLGLSGRALVKVIVTITRRPEIADPEGTTVRRALHDLGFADVESSPLRPTADARGGRAPTPLRCASRSSRCVRRLLANPVLEDFAVEVGS